MEGVRHLTVLVNPTASNGNCKREWQTLVPHFEQNFADKTIEVIETESREHTIQLAASHQTDLLVSASGDGTISNLVQGLMQRPASERPALSVIPLGSGNDFAKSLGVPMNPYLAISRMPRGQRSVIDVGQVNDTYFVNTLSFGVDAVVAERTNELRKATHRRGILLFAQAAVSSIIRDLRAHRCYMIVDGNYHERNLLICAIQNGPYYGGGFKVAPHALLDDGKFNLCLAENTSTLNALYAMARLASGTHENLKIIETLRGSSISLDFDTPIAAQIDGEKLLGYAREDGFWHFDVELIPRALEVISMR